MARVTNQSFRIDPASPHPHEVQALFRLVDCLAEDMKARLLEAHTEGKRGWDVNSAENRQFIEQKIRDKACERPLDALDLVNWTMFYWNLLL